MFELNYTKSNSDTLKNLSETDSLEIEDVQSYIPIYDKFFELNDEISNDLVLKHHYSLNLLKDAKNYNTYSANIIDEKNNERSVDVFFKYAPLLDPVKYMLGKYDNSNNELFTLPKFKSNESETHKKLLNQNNASYIDGFFVFLTSKLLHSHYFLHGVDYYGSYLCNKNNFIVDIVDDIEYLTKSSFFNDNINELFMVDETFYEKLNEGDTRSKKEAIDILDDEHVLELSDTAEIETLDKLFENKDTSVSVDEITLETNDISNSIVYDKKQECSDDDDSGSECSSRSSNTDKSLENSDDEEDNDEDSDYDFSDSDEESEDEDETLNISIQKFPVQLVCTEKCENTLDNYLMNNSDLDEEELESIILQIIMTLITYQKAFSFTHNDLHTNNIMYISTEKKYLYYKFNQKYYRIPTFGKIYKIIDFGRAIYKFRGNLLCSDSFSDEGDAASQYNFGPYLNENKNVCEPNYSFDLCRLACSLYDFIDNDDDEEDEHTSKSYKDEIDIEKVIKSWCKDDKGRNILYKKNGEERYPDFKLYKMISRSVHNHIPEKQLERECFKTYVIGKKKISNKARVIDIDSIPKY